MNLHKTYQSAILSYSIADWWANYNYYYRCGFSVLIPNLLEIVGETGIDNKSSWYAFSTACLWEIRSLSFKISCNSTFQLTNLFFVLSVLFQIGGCVDKLLYLLKLSFKTGNTGCAHRYFSCNLYQIGYNNLMSRVFCEIGYKVYGIWSGILQKRQTREFCRAWQHHR